MFENMWRDLYNDVGDLYKLEENDERKKAFEVILNMMDIYLDANLSVYLDAIYHDERKKQG